MLGKVDRLSFSFSSLRLCRQTFRPASRPFQHSHRGPLPPSDHYCEHYPPQHCSAASPVQAFGEGSRRVSKNRAVSYPVIPPDLSFPLVQSSVLGRTHHASCHPRQFALGPCRLRAAAPQPRRSTRRRGWPWRRGRRKWRPSLADLCRAVEPGRGGRGPDGALDHVLCALGPVGGFVFAANLDSNRSLAPHHPGPVDERVLRLYRAKGRQLQRPGHHGHG